MFPLLRLPAMFPSFAYGNGYKLYKYFCHLNLRKFTFSQRVIEEWNKLPTFIIESTDVATDF